MIGCIEGSFPLPLLGMRTAHYLGAISLNTMTHTTARMMECSPLDWMVGYPAWDLLHYMQSAPHEHGLHGVI